MSRYLFECIRSCECDYTVDTSRIPWESLSAPTRRLSALLEITEFDPQEISNNAFYMPDKIVAQKAGAFLENCMKEKDSAGGISDGSEILLRTAIKPTPSISQPQDTVTDQGENISLEIHGRHDPVIVPRAVVVVEAMCALTIADALLGNMGIRLDRVQEFYRK